jgi:hypothetical protein
MRINKSADEDNIDVPLADEPPDGSDFPHQ